MSCMCNGNNSDSTVYNLDLKAQLLFFLWPLCCLFFDWRILITPLVYLSSSCGDVCFPSTNVTSDYIVNVYVTNYNFQRTEGHLKAIYTLDIYPHALHVLNYINLLNLYFKQEIICWNNL
jgi:hypothetical protein